MPDIFQYLDFRNYLRDFYAEKKAATPSFSHLRFARKAGIASSGFLLHVMKGERNLSRPVMHKVSHAMGLGKAEADYFGWLVDFGQAKSQSEKNLAYDRIMAMRRKARVRQIEDGQYSFYSEWLHSVLRELAPLTPPGFAMARMAKLVQPPVSTSEVAASLNLLLELGLLMRTDGGGFAQRDPFISGSGAPTRNPAITKFQKAMLELAHEAWERFPENEISMRTATVSLSEAAVEAVKAEMKAFVERVLSLAQADAAQPDRIYHLNMGFFPLTRDLKGLHT